MTTILEWTDGLLSGSTPGPSFRYGPRHSADLLPNWRREVGQEQTEGTKTTRSVTYADPETGLEMRIEIGTFQDFPAVEWVAYFTNTGSADTPILEDIQALHVSLPCEGKEPTLHYARGAVCSMDDFEPMKRLMHPKANLRLQPGGGRSSSEILPFFNLEQDKSGIMLGIGWTGEWAASFARDTSDTLVIRAGMDATHLTLHPGEEIRTPRMLALCYEGDSRRGQNLLRQFILTHHRPTVGGKPLELPIFQTAWGGNSAASHLENIKHIVTENLPIEYYWIDAEWFGHGEWYTTAGDWTPKADLYPDGFKPISDLLHESGRKLLLWFEPERVCPGTPWFREHPDWLLAVPEDKKVFNWGESMADPAWVINESHRNQIMAGDRLFNFADPEARRFLTEFTAQRIEEYGIDCYRHDANIATLEFWRAADAPDRQGITEIAWITGLYAFWDDLLERFPNLMIDNCASGGRRIDLETLHRATPLWRSDFGFDPVARQCHSQGLFPWIPLNATFAPFAAENTHYAFRSGLSSSIVFHPLYEFMKANHWEDFTQTEALHKELAQYHAIKKFYEGDYYPLSEYSQAQDSWMAYQLHLPAEDAGIVVVLKRALSPFGNAQFALQALQAEETYEVVNLDTGQAVTMPGAALREDGLAVSLSHCPDSVIYRYHGV